MFERRMKFLLYVLLAITGVILLRVGQLQVLEKRDWTALAKDSLRRTQLVDTVRGSILDYKGRVVARDAACIDACVDYRAIEDPPNDRWVKATAQKRLRDRGEGATRAERAKLLAAETAAVRHDIDAMWETLGHLPGTTPEEVTQSRHDIVQKVVRRQRMVWYKAYARAMESRGSSSTTKPAWYKAWLAGDDQTLKIEDFESEIGDQVEAHPILRNIPSEVNNFLAKNASSMPGLVLKAGIAREYPYRDIGAHVLGYVARVSKADLDADTSDDELKEYQPSDMIGRAGLEQLLEPQLRGARGRIVQQAGVVGYAEETQAVQGKDVRASVDFELEKRIQTCFEHAMFKAHTDATPEYGPLHGAAIVIDVPTGEVRAMTSYPSYDPNSLDTLFAKLQLDEINTPMRNLATQVALEPGSTVKPMVGLGAITQGVLGLDETIECTGYLIIGGKKYSVGRCWTMKQWGPAASHHRTPYLDPHPTGFLTYTDAIQRSCNVFFENCGDRLGIEGLSFWMDKFGLGRPTGIGISEASGLIPSQKAMLSLERKHASWFAGIGQNAVLATPIQMANVAATVARDGVWVRPHLTTEAAERVDLGLNPEAVRAAKLGMTRVVNTRAGSGWAARRDDIVFAGKTGTAQAAKATYLVRDDAGNPVLGPEGKPVRKQLEMSKPGQPNPIAPWYHGSGKSYDDLAHSWFIGFAPADHPQVAFCVMIEYGGGGGGAAADVVKKVVQACIDNGYLRGKGSAPSDDAVGMGNDGGGGGGELMYAVGQGR